MARCIKLTLFAIGLCSAATPRQASQPRIFRPASDSIASAGPLSVVAGGSADATLLLDGRPVTVTRPGPGAITANIIPAAGRHELTLRDGSIITTVAFFVKTPGNASQIPAKWSEFVEHPPSDRKAVCETCHAVKNGEWRFQGASLRANCFGCHQQQTFAKVHTHEPAVIPDCQMCHSPHGSTEAKHMKLPAKAACQLCHPL